MAKSVVEKSIARRQRRQNRQAMKEDRNQRRGERRQTDGTDPAPKTPADTSPIIPMNDRQRIYLGKMDDDDQVVVLGPAGTGKTFLAASYAADEFREKRISKIILTRPNTPSGRSLGFFPGSADEKMANWVRPLVSRIKRRLGEGLFDYAVKKGQIQILPFETMRGESWEDAFIILDEAQNTTPEEIEMFLTRQGEGSKVVINGDIEQSDIAGDSGLGVVLQLIRGGAISVPVIEFDIDDIVRSGRCKAWVKAFRSLKRSAA
jgi:phosphate starvation-inducible PhoH-like protein